MCYNAVGNIDTIFRLEIIDMPRIRVALNVDYAVRRYLAGETATGIAKDLHVSLAIILARLRERGIAIRFVKPPGSQPRRHVPEAQIATRYTGGESELALSLAYAVSRTVIARVLRRLGLARRTQSESERLKWTRMTPTQRRAQTAAAHAAVRGTLQPLAHRCKIALSIEHAGRMTSNERRLHERLKEHGLLTIPQRAIGPYNCDLAASPVAMEVWVGQWHWGGEHMRRTPRRFRYLMNAGWSVLVVQTDTGHPITDATAKYVCAYVKRARRDPSALREYRVVRGAGEVLASGRANDHEITIISPLRNRRNRTNGRYESIPR